MAAPGTHVPCEHVPLVMWVVLVGQVFTEQVPLLNEHLLSLPQVPAQGVFWPAHSLVVQQLPPPLAMQAPLEQVSKPDVGHAHTPALHV